FYAYRVDDSSFFIAPPGMSGFSYFRTDKRKADESNDKVRCSVDELNRFESIAKTYNESQKETEKLKEAQVIADRKGTMTKWVKGLVSKRNDPALEKAIRGSDQAPILYIVFLTPGYDLMRNDLGIVQRKAIKTVYVYRWPQTGKCF